MNRRTSAPRKLQNSPDKTQVSGSVRRTIPETVWEQIRVAFAAGTPLRSIARNMELPVGTVLSRAAREDWSAQIQRARQTAETRLQSREQSPSPVLQSVVASLAERGMRHVQRIATITERGVEHVEAMDGGSVLDSIERIEKLDRVARRNFGLDQATPEIRINCFSDASRIIDIE